MAQVVNAQIGNSSSLADASPGVIQIDPVLTAMPSTGALSIKMHDKLAALVTLGKHLGMFAQRTQGTNVHYAISDEPMSEDDALSPQIEELTAFNEHRS
jgi:hypothetical protein